MKIFASAMNRLPLHNALKSLAWLEGTWRTEVPGEGQFPTIKSFKYCDEIKFTSMGQPMLNYESMSWHQDTKAPMHREVGVLKVIPGTNRVKLLLAHNFGLTTVEEGEFNDNVIKLKTTTISRMSEGNKEPTVTKVIVKNYSIIELVLTNIKYILLCICHKVGKTIQIQWKLFTTNIVDGNFDYTRINKTSRSYICKAT